MENVKPIDENNEEVGPDKEAIETVIDETVVAEDEITTISDDTGGPDITDDLEEEIVELEDRVADQIKSHVSETRLYPGAEKTGKILDISDSKGAKANIPDLETYGNPDMWQLLCKASSKSGGWMKSTKAMEIPEIGCLVQVTTQQGDNVAEGGPTLVKDVTIVTDDEFGGRKLVKRQPG